MLKLSDKIERLEFSGTIRISSKIHELQSCGIDVIDLCVGEPDFPTEDHVKEAAKSAINKNLTKYTLNNGIKELREAVQKKFLDEYNASYELDEIIISSGAKQALFNSILSIINDGDEVIIPIPYYVSYPAMVKLAGGIPVFCNTSFENNFKISINELKSAITPKTKAIILCNPNNPTGAVFNKDELISIAEVALENNLFIISDEVYEKLVYENIKFKSLASLNEKFKERSIIINGVSKAYAMTGWRIGYAVANKKIIYGMNKIQSHSTNHPSSISQYASLAALTGSQERVELQRKIFEERRNYLTNFLGTIKEISFNNPDGAFYFFVNVENIINKSKSINNSESFCLKLIEDANIAFVPGIVFGMEGYIRISYSKTLEDIKKAMNKFEEFLQKI